MLYIAHRFDSWRKKLFPKMFCAKFIYPNFAPTVRAMYIKQYVSIEYIKWNI